MTNKFFKNKNIFHKGQEVWCHIELIAVNKDNYMEDYTMDDETICSSAGHIPFTIRMMRVMMDVEDVKSDVSAEGIED